MACTWVWTPHGHGVQKYVWAGRLLSGGGGGGGKSLCIKNGPTRFFLPYGKFCFFPRWSLWSGEGGRVPPPLDFNYSKDALRVGHGVPNMRCTEAYVCPAHAVQFSVTDASGHGAHGGPNARGTGCTSRCVRLTLLCTAHTTAIMLIRTLPPCPSWAADVPSTHTCHPHLHPMPLCRSGPFPWHDVPRGTNGPRQHSIPHRASSSSVPEGGGHGLSWGTCGQQ